MNPQVQYLEKNGEPEYAVVPIDTYHQLLELAEDAEDIRAADKAKRELDVGETELIPDEVVGALLDGENPVKVWRKCRKVSQTVLAEQIGTSQAYIAQIEAGKREGSIKVLTAIAGVLQVDLDDLVESQTSES